MTMTDDRRELLETDAQRLLFDAALEENADEVNGFLDAVANGSVTGFHATAEDVDAVRRALSGESAD
jgi:hypothetical protein